jgi:maternal-effect protein oskar
LGDDFLLGFAILELKEEANRTGGLLQSGLCVSGMTISKATSKLRDLRNQKFDRILIYLGSFDIINGKQLIELMNDFDELVDVCLRMNLKAVACTLAPLPLHEEGNRMETLMGFNKYLKTMSKVVAEDYFYIFIAMFGCQTEEVF